MMDSMLTLSSELKLIALGYLEMGKINKKIANENTYLDSSLIISYERYLTGSSSDK